MKYTIKDAFTDLGKIDVLHESGKITKKQHDIRSLNVLKKLIKYKTK